jgi:hypothetical protein
VPETGGMLHGCRRAACPPRVIEASPDFEVRVFVGLGASRVASRATQPAQPVE